MRRLHDLNRSGRWLLAASGGLILTGIVALVVTLVLGDGGAMLRMALGALFLIASLS